MVSSFSLPHRVSIIAVRGTPRPTAVIAATACVTILVAIAIADYAADVDVKLSILYLLPVCLAAWTIGPRFAVVLGCAGALGSLAGDFASGHKLPTDVCVLNTLISISTYTLAALLLARLHALQIDLEGEVRQRVETITAEVVERQRLEQQLLDISDREQNRLGADLHDGLCQHLASAAMASQILTQKLADRTAAESGDSERVTKLIDSGIALAHSLAKGLYPVPPQADGLMIALEEFAETTTKLMKVRCDFLCASPVLVHSADVATHLFRISQEAVRNALKHGETSRISITLEPCDSGLRLTIYDHGVGITNTVSGQGLGLRIMNNRATLIGATLVIAPCGSGGTRIVCTLPVAAPGGLVRNG